MAEQAAGWGMAPELWPGIVSDEPRRLVASAPGKKQRNLRRADRLQRAGEKYLIETRKTVTLEAE